MLAAKLAEKLGGNLSHVFFNSSGSEANDTVMRMVRHYWTAKGEPKRTIFISRWLQAPILFATFMFGPLGATMALTAAGCELSSLPAGMTPAAAESGASTCSTASIHRALTFSP